MKKLDLSWYAGQIAGDELWLSPNNAFGFFTININTWEIKHVDVKIDKYDLSLKCKQCFSYGRNLYFFIMPGIGYYKLNLDTHNCSLTMYRNGVLTSEIVKKDERHLIITETHLSEGIIIFDMENETFTALDISSIKELTQLKESSSREVITGCVIGNDFYTAVKHSDVLIGYNLVNNKTRVFNIEGHNKTVRISSVISADDSIYISLLGEKTIVKFTPANIAYAYIGPSKALEPDMAAYSKIIFSQDRIIGLPSIKGEKICIINPHNNDYKIIEYPRDFLFNKDNIYAGYYYGYDINKDNLYIFELAGNMMLVLNLTTASIIGRKIETEVSMIYKDYLDNGFIIEEQSDFSLREYLDCLVL